MATSRPPAVVSSASAIPAETDAIPPPDLAMPSNARMMPMTVPNRPTNGAVAPMVARTPRFSFSSATVIMAERHIPWRGASTASSGSVVRFARRGGTDGGENAEVPLQLSTRDHGGAVHPLARRFDGQLRIGVAFVAARSLELEQAGGDDFRQVALLVLLGDLDRLRVITLGEQV